MLRSQEFAEAARFYLREDLEHVCMDNIKTCILICEYASAHSDKFVEAMYFSIAARMAQLLRLDTDLSKTSTIDLEIQRRVWASCFMMDVWSSAGLDIPKQLDRIFRPLSLMDETRFQNLMPAQEASESGSPRPGLWFHMISLAQIFICVQEFHKQLLSQDSNELAVDEMAAALSSKFDQYMADLPPSATLSDENLNSHISNGTGQSLVALHLGYHHYATLLYFHYLERTDSGTNDNNRFANSCKDHAAALSDIIRMTMERPGCEAKYHIVGHMTTISSSVLLYTLLFGHSSEIDAARTRLNVNFAKLMELSKFWPGTDRFVSRPSSHHEAVMANRYQRTRLLRFQDACMWSISPRTHKIDNWMLKFLLNYALALPPKFSESTALEDRTNVTSQAFSAFLPASIH